MTLSNNFVLNRLIIAFAFTLSLSYGQIYNIDNFLEKCPTNDPIYEKILDDFIILRNYSPANLPSCTAPISQIPIENYTEEIIILQGLRAIYYMDKNMSNHLPWTDKNLYDWLKSNIDGFHIRDDFDSGSSLTIVEGNYVIRVPKSSEVDKEYDRTWIGLAGNIAVYMHEARHRDFGAHVSCCGIDNGCDDEYDETNLTCYGIQHWLYKAWLTGIINIGIDCLDDQRKQEILSWHKSDGNSFADRFCNNPPEKLEIPDFPISECVDLSTIVPNTPANFNAIAGDGNITLSWSVNNEPDLYQYNLYKKTQLSGRMVHLVGLRKNRKSYTDYDIINDGTTYYYQISATDSSNNQSPLSPQVSVLPLDMTAPASPTNFSAATGEGQVILSWDANTESDFYQYNLIRDPAFINISPIIHITGINNTSFVDISASNGNTYSYQISASDNFGNTSSFSSQISATPKDMTPPAVPNNLNAIAENGHVILSWYANTESDFYQYNLIRDPAFIYISPIIHITGINNTSYVDASVTSNNVFQYQISASDSSNNESSLSSQVSVTTLNVNDKDKTIKFSLEQNIPNPFNPNTEIVYSIPFSGKINITIYDLAGNEIKMLLDEYKPIGQYKVSWNGTNESDQLVSGGVYFYTLQLDGMIQAKKMILMK